MGEGDVDGAVGPSFGPEKDNAGAYSSDETQRERVERTADLGIGEACDGDALLQAVPYTRQGVQVRHDGRKALLHACDEQLAVGGDAAGIGDDDRFGVSALKERTGGNSARGS